MVLRTINYTGNETAQTDTLNNFILDPTDGLVFEPSNGSEKVEGLAYRSHQIQDSLSPSWVSASYTITRDTDITPADYRLLTTLYGVTDNGTVETIGEDLITTCSTTETTETRNFLFHKCTNKPYFTKDTGTASSGKINLNLPLRGENYTALNLYKTYTYYDDFEDNKYTGRTSPYLDWAKLNGTLAIESGAPITGAYSIKFTGNGNDAIENQAYKSIGTSPLLTGFDFKLTTQGAGANTPFIFLWLLRYQNSSNYLTLRSYYHLGSGNQMLQVIETKAGSQTSIQEVNWLTGKMPTNTVYNFYIIDTTSNIQVFVNGSRKINMNYSSTITPTYHGFGANRDSVGVWDNIWYHIPKQDNQFSTAINSDSVSAEDMVASFTLPSYWGLNTPVRFGYQRVDNNEYKGNTISLSNTNTVRMGYHGLGNYKTLGLRFESYCNDEYSFNINNIVFKYEM